jgi:hypothetical protein
MPTRAPHHWTVITRIPSVRRATIERVPTDATNVVPCVPCPLGYHVPLLDGNFECHASAAQMRSPNIKKRKPIRCVQTVQLEWFCRLKSDAVDFHAVTLWMLKTSVRFAPPIELYSCVPFTLSACRAVSVGTCNGIKHSISEKVECLATNSFQRFWNSNIFWVAMLSCHLAHRDI